MSYSLFSGITSGLTSTYSILSAASSGNITLSSIASAQSNSTYAATLNPTFASYITSNFATLDTDHNGVLSSTELSKLTNSINSTGMTSAQLSQLGTATGLSSSDLNQVLSHFADIDKNGDGKVTATEIQNYKLSSEMDKKKTEFSNRAASTQSVFYGNDDASSKADSSSMLSYKYWQDGSTNSSGS